MSHCAAVSGPGLSEGTESDELFMVMYTTVSSAKKHFWDCILSDESLIYSEKK